MPYQQCGPYVNLVSKIYYNIVYNLRSIRACDTNDRGLYDLPLTSDLSLMSAVELYYYYNKTIGINLFRGVLYE